MNLSEIWADQKEFNSHFVNFSTLNFQQQQEITKEYILLLLDELHELLREINFKSHRPTQQVILSNLKEEIIDVFKYWLSIVLVWDLSPEDIIEEYWRKSRVVRQRYIQEMELNLVDEKNIVAVDIDGVLADYPKSFQDFIEKKTGIRLEIINYDLFELYGETVGKERFLKLKHEYRITGQKRFIPLCPGAKEFCDRIHASGDKIIFLTSRPHKQYKRIWADTMEWLNEQGLKKDGDAIIFDEEKNYQAIREFPGIKFMVEDNLNFANRIAQEGYTVYLIDQAYNRGPTHTGVCRIANLGEIPIGT